MDPLAEAKVTEHGWPEWSLKKTDTRYLSKSFIAFLVPAVEILSGIEHKGLSCFYMSEMAICGRKKEGENTSVMMCVRGGWIIHSDYCKLDPLNFYC